MDYRIYKSLVINYEPMRDAIRQNNYSIDDEKKMKFPLDELRKLSFHNIEEKLPREKRTDRYYWILKNFFLYFFPATDKLELRIREKERDILNNKIIKLERVNDDGTSENFFKIDIMPDINLKDIERIYEIEFYDNELGEGFYLIYSLVIDDEEYYISIDVDNEFVYSSCNGTIFITKDLSYLTRRILNVYHENKKIEFFIPYNNLTLKRNKNYLSEIQSFHVDERERKRRTFKLIYFWMDLFTFILFYFH